MSVATQSMHQQSMMGLMIPQSMHHQSMGVKRELLNDSDISHNNPAPAAAVPRRGQSCFTRYQGEEAWMNDIITTEDGEVGGKRTRVEQNHQGQPLNKKPLLGMPGGPSDIGLPKLPVDDILKMKGSDCTKELRKIKSAQDKAGLPNKHQIHISGRAHELQIRLADYYYPSYDGITTVLLPKGCCDFDVEKVNDWMLKVTTIGKGFELFGVGSIILSINKEPLSTKYTNGSDLMGMACMLFKGEVKNTSTKFLEVVPYTPPITSGVTAKSKSTAMFTASTDVEAPEEDSVGLGDDNHHDVDFNDIEAEEPASKPPAEDNTNQSSEAESMNSTGAAGC